jgi:RNA polymerase primary sigma factor
MMEHSHRDGTRCSDPHTLEEIGKELGITRERVRQIERNALNKLRRNPLARTLFQQFVKSK